MISTIEVKGLIPGLESMPCVTVIIPYTARLKNKKQLHSLLCLKTDEAAKELLEKYPEEIVLPLINKLRKTITVVRCPGHGKSIGIFVSPVAEKVYYFSPSHLEDCIIRTRNFEG